MASIHEQLVIRRKELGLSQAEAGQLADPPIPQKTVSQMESVRVATRLPTVERYAAALGCELQLIEL